MVAWGKQGQAVGDLGGWGQKGAITCKPKRVENWGQWGRGKETRTHEAAITLEAAGQSRVLERGLWLESFPGVCWEAGVCLGAGS